MYINIVPACYRYDFHRGIDIPTPVGTPVRAIDSGKILVAGSHKSYSDPLVQVHIYTRSYILATIHNCPSTILATCMYLMYTLLFL